MKLRQIIISIFVLAFCTGAGATSVVCPLFSDLYSKLSGTWLGEGERVSMSSRQKWNLRVTSESQKTNIGIYISNQWREEDAALAFDPVFYDVNYYLAIQANGCSADKLRLVMLDGQSLQPNPGVTVTYDGRILVMRWRLANGFEVITRTRLEQESRFSSALVINQNLVASQDNLRFSRISVTRPLM